MNIVPIDRSYTLSTSVPLNDVPTSKGAIDAMLTRAIGHEIAAMLRHDGFSVPDEQQLIEASQVTVDIRTEPAHAIFLVRFPHPHDSVPDELHPLDGHKGELIGGPHDGLIVDMIYGEVDYYDERGVEHARTGYNLTDGTWTFDYLNVPAASEESETA